MDDATETSLSSPTVLASGLARGENAPSAIGAANTPPEMSSPSSGLLFDGGRAGDLSNSEAPHNLPNFHQSLPPPLFRPPQLLREKITMMVPTTEATMAPPQDLQLQHAAVVAALGAAEARAARLSSQVASLRASSAAAAEAAVDAGSGGSEYRRRASLAAARRCSGDGKASPQFRPSLSPQRRRAACAAAATEPAVAVRAQLRVAVLERQLVALTQLVECEVGPGAAALVRRVCGGENGAGSCAAGQRDAPLPVASLAVEDKVDAATHSAGWRGRAQKLVLLKARVRELEERMEAWGIAASGAAASKTGAAGVAYFTPALHSTCPDSLKTSPSETKLENDCGIVEGVGRDGDDVADDGEHSGGADHGDAIRASAWAASGSSGSETALGLACAPAIRLTTPRAIAPGGVDARAAALVRVQQARLGGARLAAAENACVAARKEASVAGRRAAAAAARATAAAADAARLESELRVAKEAIAAGAAREKALQAQLVASSASGLREELALTKSKLAFALLTLSAHTQAASVTAAAAPEVDK